MDWHAGSNRVCARIRLGRVHGRHSRRVMDVGDWHGRRIAHRRAERPAGRPRGAHPQRCGNGHRIAVCHRDRLTQPSTLEVSVAACLGASVAALAGVRRASGPRTPRSSRGQSSRGTACTVLPPPRAARCGTGSRTESTRPTGCARRRGAPPRLRGLPRCLVTRPACCRALRARHLRREPRGEVGVADLTRARR